MKNILSFSFTCFEAGEEFEYTCMVYSKGRKLSPAHYQLAEQKLRQWHKDAHIISWALS